MKKLSLLCLPFLLIPFLSCSQSTDPEEDPPPQDEFEMIAEADIGSEGGVLEAEGIELSIPSGAFTASQALELYVSETDLPYEGNRASTLFRLEGLPEDFEGELELSITYEGELSENSYIAEGRYGFNFNNGEMTLGYFMQDTNVSDDQLVAPITALNTFAPDAGRSSENLRLIRYFIALTSVYIEGNEFFSVHGYDYDDIVLNLLTSKLNWFFDNWAMVWLPTDIKFPIEVEIMEYIDGAIFTLPRDLNSGGPLESKIYVSEDLTYPDIAEDLPGNIGKELTYNHLKIAERRDITKPQRWPINFAFIIWSEEIFQDSPESFIPGKLAGNEYRILEGFIAGASNPNDSASLTTHIQGHCALAKFLMNDPRFSYPGFRTVYEDVLLDGASPMEALLDYMGDPIDVWYTDFLISYFQGEIYGVTPDKLTVNALSGWTPSTENPEYEINQGEQAQFKDLSAKIIPITLLGPFTENAVLTFQVSSDEVNDDLLELVLFYEENGSFHYLGHGNHWSLSQIQSDLVDQQIDKLWALVVNTSHAVDYLGSSTLYLSMELDQSLSFNTLDANLIINTTGVNSNYPDFVVNRFEHLMRWVGEGNITGTTFNVPIDQTIIIGDWRSEVSGHIEGTVNEDFTELLTLYAESTTYLYENEVYLSSGTQSMTLSQTVNCEPDHRDNNRLPALSLSGIQSVHFHGSAPFPRPHLITLLA